MVLPWSSTPRLNPLERLLSSRIGMGTTQEKKINTTNPFRPFIYASPSLISCAMTSKKT